MEAVRIDTTPCRVCLLRCRKIHKPVTRRLVVADDNKLCVFVDLSHKGKDRLLDDVRVFVLLCFLIHDKRNRRLRCLASRSLTARCVRNRIKVCFPCSPLYLDAVFFPRNVILALRVVSNVKFAVFQKLLYLIDDRVFDFRRGRLQYNDVFVRLGVHRNPPKRDKYTRLARQTPARQHKVFVIVKENLFVYVRDNDSLCRQPFIIQKTVLLVFGQVQYLNKVFLTFRHRLSYPHIPTPTVQRHCSCLQLPTSNSRLQSTP